MGLCASFSFADMMTSPDDFKDMLNTATPYTSELLNTTSFCESKSTRQIQTLFWPRSAKLITYRSSSCIISVDEVKNLIENNFKNVDKMIKTITVKVIDLNWFMHEDMKFLILTQILNQA